MQDIAHELNQPSVIDLKMGRVTHDPEADEDKILRQKFKYPPVENLGFQLLGMRVRMREFFSIIM
jgi:1D-myo-inositol-tetrakisphosphate 5-kinase/inositol-polyphosphate multikinase